MLGIRRRSQQVRVLPLGVTEFRTLVELGLRDQGPGDRGRRRSPLSTVHRQTQQGHKGRLDRGARPWFAGRHDASCLLIRRTCWGPGRLCGKSNPGLGSNRDEALDAECSALRRLSARDRRLRRPGSAAASKTRTLQTGEDVRRRAPKGRGSRAKARRGTYPRARPGPADRVRPDGKADRRIQPTFGLCIRETAPAESSESLDSGSSVCLVGLGREDGTRAAVPDSGDRDDGFREPWVLASADPTGRLCGCHAAFQCWGGTAGTDKGFVRCSVFTDDTAVRACVRAGVRARVLESGSKRERDVERLLTTPL